MVLIKYSGKYVKICFNMKIKFSPFRLFSSPVPMSFLRAGTSSEVTHPEASPSSPSLPSEGRDEGVGGSQYALVLLPDGLPLLPLDICPTRGVQVPLVARPVRSSSLLGVQELLSCGRLLLLALSRLSLPPHLCTPCEVMGRESLQRFALSSVASPSSSLNPLQGDEAGESSEACSRSSQASRSSAWEARKEL